MNGLLDSIKRFLFRTSFLIGYLMPWLFPEVEETPATEKVRPVTAEFYIDSAVLKATDHYGFHCGMQLVRDSELKLTPEERIGVMSAAAKNLFESHTSEGLKPLNAKIDWVTYHSNRAIKFTLQVGFVKVDGKYRPTVEASEFKRLANIDRALNAILN